MPAKKENPRNTNLLIAVSPIEKAAIQRKAKEQKTSVSNIGYEMLKRGSLQTLVASYVDSDSIEKSS